MKPTIIGVSDSRLHNLIRYEIKHQSLNLEWKVKLKQNLNPININSKTVYISNKDKAIIPSDIICISDNEILIRPTRSFDSGETYTLNLLPVAQNKISSKKISVSFALPRLPATANTLPSISTAPTLNNISKVTPNPKPSRSKVVLIGSPIFLIILLLWLLLFGFGEKTIKGYTDETGSKIFFVDTHVDYNSIQAETMFSFKINATIRGYQEAP